MNKKEIAEKIDHTLLNAVAGPDDIRALCAEAKKYSFASVCVNPWFVRLAAEELAGSDVMVCTVAGFPLGANSPEIKAAEAEFAVSQGADEVDMVINIGALKAGDIDYCEREIAAVVDAAAGRTVKVIIETCHLTDEEKKGACRAAMSAKAHFVKTSTGFGGGGATVADVKLMRQVVGDTMRIKAAGGVRSLSDAAAMIDAGADRIGTSGGPGIMEDNSAGDGY